MKIRAAESALRLKPVPVDSLQVPGIDAIGEIVGRCRIANSAVYELGNRITELEQNMLDLKAFARALGFDLLEDHRSASENGVVALRTSNAPSQKGYIPYSSRAMNWHTDGYYNAPQQRVSAFILHCHAQAQAGGANQLLDPEIAYLRLREADPDFVRAFMHPSAMTIPENREPDGSLRPASVGPVFYADSETGRLQMRYTARTRSIEWRDDPATRDAAQWLRDWLEEGDPLIQEIRLSPGQGIVSNNALHNRTGFSDGAEPESTRTMLRVRFHQRTGRHTRGTAE